MLPGFIALIFLAAALASAAICRLHGKPALGWILRSRPLRYGTLAAGVPAAAVGAIVALATDSWLLAAGGALIASAPSLHWLHRARKRSVRFLSPLDEETVQAIVTDLRRQQPAPGETSMTFEVRAVLAAKQLMEAGRLDVAAKVLQLLDWDQIEGVILVTGASILSTCYLRSGLVAEARQTLERARAQVAEFGDADLFAVLDTRLLVHEGHPERALERIDELQRIAERQPQLRLDTQLVRIHAAAGHGDSDTALTLIGALRREHGPEILRMLAQPEGPATAMAAELSARSAYR